VHFDYTTVGHVTVDVTADGSRRAGGSAFYSALQAARLGQRTLIITQGAPGEIEELLEPYRSELELEIRPARQSTTLQSTTRASAANAGARAQRMIAWAGAIDEGVEIDTSILHLAPVARETPSRWRGPADFVGLTPQGLVRAWARQGAEIGLVPLAPALLPERCDAIVFSQTERDSAALLITGGRRSGSLATGSTGLGGSANASPTPGTVVAVTAEAAPTTIHLPGGGIARVEVPAIEDFRDDVGAGDVFAAAFFVALRDGLSERAAAAFANAAAAVRIAGAGASAIGDRPAIRARLRAVAGAQ
jgi:sugar/nucleoside kinase (ribokinase family)